MMLIDTMDLQSCISVEEILELCVEPMKKLMTDAEQDEIKTSLVKESDAELIKELGGTKEDALDKAREAILDQFLSHSARK